MTFTSEGRVRKIQHSFCTPKDTSREIENDRTQIADSETIAVFPFGINRLRKRLNLIAVITPAKKKTIPLPTLLVFGLEDTSLITTPRSNAAKKNWVLNLVVDVHMHPNSR